MFRLLVACPRHPPPRSRGRGTKLALVVLAIDPILRMGCMQGKEVAVQQTQGAGASAAPPGQREEVSQEPGQMEVVSAPEREEVSAPEEAAAAPVEMTMSDMEKQLDALDRSLGTTHD
eukprot:COSAG01_NODE_12356_length_1753_cov_206.075574_1_plen_118_part_00